MNRRELLSAAGALTAAAMAAAPAIAAEQNHDHSHMTGGPNAKIAMSALHCVGTGDACIAHCFDSFIAGDTTLAACAKKVDELIAVCSALVKMASNNSPNLAAYAKVAAAVCKDCEKECRKHAGKHATCKACADACVECAEACAKL